jgi:hypothetical protein
MKQGDKQLLFNAALILGGYIVIIRPILQGLDIIPTAEEKSSKPPPKKILSNGQLIGSGRRCQPKRQGVDNNSRSDLQCAEIFRAG